MAGNNFMIPRLYIDVALEPDNGIILSVSQIHYLKNVLRLETGATILLFNGRDGEFAADLVEMKKRGGRAKVTAKTRDLTTEPDLQLAFAPVKRGPLEVIVQKAVEIGVSQLTPVITERTNAPKVNVDRLRTIAIEAAEQCGRLTIPHVDEPIKLDRLLTTWPEKRRLMFCDEAGDDENQTWGGREGRAQPALDALKASDRKAQPWAVLTGPEGGFSNQERGALRDNAFVIPVTLGPRILRADTAAIAALTLWQAALGDWNQS